MPLTVGSVDQRKRVGFYAGITGNSFQHTEFVDYLNASLKGGWAVAGYHDARLEQRVKVRTVVSSHLLTNLSADPHFISPQLLDISRTIVTELINECPYTQEKFPIILYSSDCLLAPYIQKIVNELPLTITGAKRAASFVLIDQPPLPVLKKQSDAEILRYTFDILQRVASSLHFITPTNLDLANFKLNEINDDGMLNLNQKLDQVFAYTIPNFQTQITNIKHTYGHREAVQAATILPLTLANIKSIYNSEYKPSTTAKLEKALVISTKTTCEKYAVHQTLGWEQYVKDPSKNLTVLHLPHSNHFSVLTPPITSGGHLVRDTIITHFKNSDIALSPPPSPAIMPSLSSLSPLSLSLETKQDSPTSPLPEITSDSESSESSQSSGSKRKRRREPVIARRYSMRKELSECVKVLGRKYSQAGFGTDEAVDSLLFHLMNYFPIGYNQGIERTTGTKRTRLGSTCRSPLSFDPRSVLFRPDSDTSSQDSVSSGSSCSSK